MAARRRAGSFSPKTSCRLRVSKVAMLWDMAGLLSASSAAGDSSTRHGSMAEEAAGTSKVTVATQGTTLGAYVLPPSAAGAPADAGSRPEAAPREVVTVSYPGVT